MSAIPYSVFKKDFRWEKTIGKGSCAVVNQYYHAVSKQSYAVKRVELKSYDDFMQAINEIQVIRLIDDEKATKVFFFYSLPGKENGNFQLGIVMELCKESLGDLIKTRKNKKQYFKKEDLRILLTALVPFFAKMQTKGILHRDIKPDNILLARTKKTDYRVADFGFAIKQNEYSYRNVAGTMEYVSPKLLVKFKNHNASVAGHNIKDDVYSFGKTLGEYMTLDNDWLQKGSSVKECTERYGKDYAFILALTMKQNESERVDFVQLHQYLVNKKLIDFSELEHPKPTLSLDKVKLQHSVVRETSVKKNQSHYTRSSNQQKTIRAYSHLRKSQNKRSPSLENTESTIPTIRKDDHSSVSENDTREWKKKVVPIKDQINCLEICENLLFLGMQDRLGIMIIASSKLIRVSYMNSLKDIYCLRVFQEQQILIVGTLQGKLFFIPILELKKLMISNNDSFKVKNTIDVTLEGLKFKEYNVGSPLSTCAIIQPNLKSAEPIVVVGHYTGEVTVISNNKAEKKITFCTQPITHIEVRDGMLYTSTAYGIFKRQSALSLGLIVDTSTQESKKDLFLSSFSNQTYNCNQPIVSFSIISHCKKNKSIKKEPYQYLALVVCWNGMVYVISKSMRCEIAFRISENNILGCFFTSNPHNSYGAEVWAVDEEGMVVDMSGNVIAKTDEKELMAVASNGQNIFCGGLNKKVVCLTAVGATINLE